MRYFQLPDGRLFQLPENPTPEFKDEFKAKLYEKFPNYYGTDTSRSLDEELDRSWFGIGEEGVGHVGEIVKGIPRGIGTTVLSGLEGLSQFFDVGNDEDRTIALGEMKKSFNDLDWLKPKEGYEDALSTQFGQGLGSMASFVGAGMVNPFAIGALAVGSGVSQQADNIGRTRDEGKEVSGFQEFVSEFGGGAVGASEIIVPKYLTNLLKQIPKGEGKGVLSGAFEKVFRRVDEEGNPLGSLKDYTISGAGVGLAEGTQEALASITQNLISQKVFDADIPLNESAFEEFTVGGLVGFTADAMVRAAGRVSIRDTYNNEQALKQNEKDKERKKYAKDLDKKYQEGGRKDIDLARFPENPEDQDIIQTNRGEFRISEINNYEFTSSEFSNLDAEGNALPTKIDTMDTATMLDTKASLERNIRNSEKLIKSGTFTQEEINNQKNDLQAIELALAIQGRNNGSFVRIPTPPQGYRVKVDENGRPIFNDRNEFQIEGIEDNIVYESYKDIETASLRAVQLGDESNHGFIIDSSKNASAINGLLGNGTAERIGHRVYDPNLTEIDAKAIANADKKIGIERSKQAKIEQELIDKEEEFIASPEGQQQLVNELYMTAQQSGLPRGPSFQELENLKNKKIQERLAKSNVVPIPGTQVYNNSQLGLLWQRAEKLGLEKKNFYSIEEAKKLLDNKDFDSLMTGIAETRFTLNKQEGKISPSSRKISPISRTDKGSILQRIRGEIDLSNNAFKNIFDIKNIEVDFNSPEFQYFAKSLGGETSLSKMTKGQKLAFMSKIAMLPKFDTKTKLPDYSPKPYTANDVNRFYQIYKGKRFSNKDIKIGIKNSITGADLSTKEINQFKKDLINSGRAVKQKNNQTKMINDFKSVQEKRMQSYSYENEQQYSDRLKATTSLNEDQINEKVETKSKDDQVLLLEDKTDSNLNKNYKMLFDNLRERLNTYGLKDVGLNLVNEFKGGFGLVERNGEVIFDTSNDQYQKIKKDKATKALYDHSLQSIFLSTTRVDPDNKLTTEQFEENIMTSLDHETIHALIDMGLLTEKEFQILLRDAKRILPAQTIKNVRALYADRSEAIVNEEIVARFFEETRKQERQPSPKSKRLIDRIINFFKSIKNAIADSGFTTSRTIYNDIVSGKIGSRERDQALNMQRVRTVEQEEGLELDREITEAKKLLDQEQPLSSKGVINPNEERIYQLEQVLYGKKGQIRTDQLSPATYNKLMNEIQQLENQISLLKNQPTFNRAGLTPKQILYAGDIERAVYDLWLDTDGNPTAQDFAELFKKISPTSKKNHKFKDYSEYKRIVKEGYEKGYNDRWYEDWGINIPNLIGTANMLEFSAIFGITSAQATPEINLKSTLRTMIIARQIDPVKNPKKFINALRNWGRGNKEIPSIAMRNNDRLKGIQKFYELGVFEKQGSGQKTTTYGLETLMAMQGKFTPFMVADRHMVRQYGLDEKTEVATEQEYRIMQAINGLLATEDYTTNGLPNTFTPSQVQALMWADQRFEGETADRIANEGSYTSAERYANTEIVELRNMESSGTFSKENSLYNYFIAPPRYSSSRKTNIFDTGVHDAMWDSITESAPQVVLNIKTGINRGYLPNTLDAPIPFKSLRRYQEKLLQSITSGGKIKFLRDLGIAHEITMSGSTWDGDLTPTMVIQLPGLDPQSQSAVTSLLTDALMQDGAVLQIPDKTANKSGLIINKTTGKKITVKEITSMQKQLSSLQRDGNPLSFTMLSTDKSGIVLIDSKSYSDNYTTEDALDFVKLVQPVLKNIGMELKSYGQNSQVYRYGKDTSNSKGTRGALRNLGDRISFIGSSDLQRKAIRDVYLPAFRTYRNFAKEIGIIPNAKEPFLQEDSAVQGINSQQAELIKAEEIARERVKNTPRGYVPRINHKASPLAIKTALDLEDGKDIDLSATKPLFSREIDPEFQELHDEISGKPTTGTKENTISKVVEEVFEEENIKSFLTRQKTEYIDNIHTVEKGVRVAGSLNPKVRAINERAMSGAIQALRYVGQAKSLFSKILTVGAPALVDQQGKRISKEIKNQGGTMVLPREKGGLVQIFAPLFSNPNLNLEALFKVLAIARRSVRLSDEGKDIPVTKEFVEKAERIVEKYPIVEEVYNNWQELNNEIIDYAVQTGILSEVITKNQVIENILDGEFNNVKWSLEGLDQKTLNKMSKEDLIAMAESLGADTRGTAQVWKDNSDFYPFYRDIQTAKDGEQKLGGPKIASGFLVGNPLAIELKGSEKEIEPEPIEVIGRNIFSILTAGLKNEGMARLVKTYEMSGLARPITQKQASGNEKAIVFYEDGLRKDYEVFDPILIEGLQSMGIYDGGTAMAWVGGASSLLRETVTRDPGFMLKNMLRDTISVWATSGAPITPFVDTFKNFNADLTLLENAGIIGGYDAARDREDVVKLIQRELQKQGLDENNSTDPLDSAIKLWDWLGEQTTKSDGATRKAVHDVILENSNDIVEANYQALEIINFNRRGANPLFRIITTAIPFLNARLQGLDVLGRTARGTYSAIPSPSDQQLDSVRKARIVSFATRYAVLTGLTGAYYMLVSDTDEYKQERLQSRDDNYIIPNPLNYLIEDARLPALKIPIPFEIGVLTKSIPERILDNQFGETDIRDLERSITRQMVATFKLDIFGFQIVKPLMEAVRNKNSFTGNDIVPSWMEQQLLPEEQYTRGTSEVARLIGEGLNIAPLKIDHVMRGYGGTIGTYIIQLVDMAMRQVTDREFIAPDITDAPFIRTILQSDFKGASGGLQEQFYELKKESLRFQTTVNKLKKEGRGDELQAYFKNNEGLAKTRPEVLRIDRYMKNYRKIRRRIEIDENLSPTAKKEMLRDLDIQRNIRLAYVPELKQEADLRGYITGLLRN